MVNYSNMPSVGRMAVMASSFLSVANAHMFIAEPKPIQGYAPKDPLDQSGSNWPCHGAPLPSSGGQKMAAGENFDLKLELGGGANNAVHGGGSCQLAILYDTDKAADPNSWKVIYSIEGGCPSNTKGNLGTATQCQSDDEGDCVHSWEVPMPKGVESGNAILSWTWFNTIGNREMYQNCVNVDITGGTGDEMESFPAMYVANIGSASDGCETTEGEDVLFPNPGEHVTTMSATNGFNQAKATATCGGGSGGSGGNGGNKPAPSSYGGGAPTSAPVSSAPASYSAAPTAADYSVPDHVQSGIQSYGNQKGRETSTQAAKAQTTFATSASRAVAPSSAAPAPTGYSSGSESNTTTSSDSTECSEEGALICIGDDAFGICDHGAAVSRPLASGTVCKDGVISGRNRFRRHVHGAHKH